MLLQWLRRLHLLAVFQNGHLLNLFGWHIIVLSIRSILIFNLILGGFLESTTNVRMGPFWLIRALFGILSRLLLAIFLLLEEADSSGDSSGDLLLGFSNGVAILLDDDAAHAAGEPRGYPVADAHIHVVIEKFLLVELCQLGLCVLVISKVGSAELDEVCHRLRVAKIGDIAVVH